MQEKQEKVRGTLLAPKLVIARLPFAKRSFAKPFRSDGEGLRSISLVVTAEEQNPFSLALQAGCDGHACPMQTRTQAEQANPWWGNHGEEIGADRLHPFPPSFS